MFKGRNGIYESRKDVILQRQSSNVFYNNQKTNLATPIPKRQGGEYVLLEREWCPRYEQWSITGIKHAAHTMNIPYPTCRAIYKELDATVTPELKKGFSTNRE